MLPRYFSVLFFVAATVGAAIAMGIFRLPQQVAQNLPHPYWFLSMWVVGALYCLCAACPLAELASTFPRSGGSYPYVRLTFGELPAFLMGYMDWGMITAASALIATVAGDHLVSILGLPPSYGVWLASLMVVTLMTVHCFGPRKTSIFQVAATSVKVLVFVLIVGGLLMFGRAPVETGHGQMPQGVLHWSTAMFLALQAVIATFGGWALPIYFAGESRDGPAVLPRAIFRGVLSIAAVYLSMMVVLVMYVPITEIAAQKAPFSYAARALFGGRGDLVLTILVFLILISALSACIIAAPRVLYALASDGLFLRAGTKLNRHGSPMTGLLLSSGVVVAYLFTRTFGELLGVLALYDVIGYSLMIVSVFILRRTRPEVSRPYRAWGHPFTTAVASVVSISFVVAAFVLDTRNALIAMGLALVSIPIYFVVRSRRAA